MADDPWESGAAYERFMGRWSRASGRAFVRWLAAPDGVRWADVGTGTGALAQSIVELTAPAAVTAVDPSPSFLAFARRQVVDPRVRFVSGRADALPLATDAVEVLVSGFALNFVPDPAAALREMVRVVRPSGAVAALVWDYREGMEFLKRFWSVAAQLDPRAEAMDEGARFPLCRPDPLRELFATAGLERVRVEAIATATRFADFDDYWQPFLAGTGPAPGYLVALSEAQREALRARLQDDLAPATDGSIGLTARAWGVVGSVAG